MTSATYANELLADQRLMLLQALGAASGYSLPERALSRFLQSMSAPLSADGLRTQLAWLEEQALLGISKVHPVPDAAPEWTARINARGLDVVDGIVRVPGIARPRP
ncbi:conserved hypothetical protein [Thiomonas sp. CB3]|nr:conserved hypothetical protein [Thiomonas sp. CB3]